MGAICAFVFINLNILHFVHFVSEHTLDFVAHGFLAGFAEMDCYLVSGLADLLHKVGLSGLCGCGIEFFVIHRYSSGASCACRPIEAVFGGR